jgi:hypothetical protein
MNPGEQFNLIKRLLREQDQVLDQLDELNARVEGVLKTLQPHPEEATELQNSEAVDAAVPKAA